MDARVKPAHDERSMQFELATDGADFGRLDQPRMGDSDRVQRSFEVASPIARALIGKGKGETIEVEAPGGAKVYKIQRVEWL